LTVLCHVVPRILKPFFDTANHDGQEPNVRFLHKQWLRDHSKSELSYHFNILPSFWSQYRNQSHLLHLQIGWKFKRLNS
jgi:hypothetical protein